MAQPKTLPKNDRQTPLTSTSAAFALSTVFPKIDGKQPTNSSEGFFLRVFSFLNVLLLRIIEGSHIAP